MGTVMDEELNLITDEIVYQNGTQNGVTFYFVKGDVVQETFSSAICQTYMNSSEEYRKFLFSFRIIPIRDIKLVMDQAKVDFETARKALVECQGDIVNAIMSLC